MRLSVVHVVVAREIGGAEHFVANMASHPEATGCDHSIALMTVNPILRELFADARLKVHDRGPLRTYPFAYYKRALGPTDVAWLANIVREERADIIQAHTFGSHILAARAGLSTNVSVVRTEHGVGHYRDPARSLYRHWSLLNTTRVVAVSEFVASFVLKLEPRAKVVVIRNGIDTEHFAPTPPLSGPFTLAMTARLDPVKNIAIAIEALARIRDVRLKIAGSGILREKLERLARDRGLKERVEFLGYQADTRPVIAASHAVINCTKQEGIGLAVIEAASMQRPAIAYAGGGIPEIVRHDHTGWLARDCTPDAFARLIVQASADRAKTARLGANAREWTKTHFAFDGMCRAYAQVYAELTANRSAAVAAKAHAC